MSKKVKVSAGIDVDKNVENQNWLHEWKRWREKAKKK